MFLRKIRSVKYRTKQSTMWYNALLVMCLFSLLSVIEHVSYLEYGSPTSVMEDIHLHEKNSTQLQEWSLRSTFHRLQIIYGQFQTLAPPDHTYCVPLIIVQILTRKNSLWTFACRTVQTTVNTHTYIHTACITDRLRNSRYNRIRGRGGT